MAGYSMSFTALWAYRDAFVSGAAVTLELTLLSIFLGTIIGLAVCFARMSKMPAIDFIAKAYVEVFRDLPLLVVLIWLFYVVPPAFGVRLSAFETAVAALALNLGAFASDIFLAGARAVPSGQREAGRALGIGDFQIAKDIVLPQALRTVIPPLAGRYIETIKLTSLASFIAVDELLHVGGNIIALTYRPIEVYTIIALIYFVIIAPLVFVLGRLERGIKWTRR